jgi:lipopolysaccharide/colanic/teichoic acid biosynthesis glycosyltransferase
MIFKRYFDLFFTLPGLLILMPIFLLAAILIKVDNPGPVFFHQERVGKDGKLFRIRKFRTMVMDAETIGTQITIGGRDPRITRIGYWLRKSKFDELPQLINVLLGTMSLVGPRPEVPKYMEKYPEETRRKILSVPPGITDFASIEFRDENEILGKAADPEKAYIEEIMPIKARYYMKYVEERSVFLDLKLIFLTFWRIFFPRKSMVDLV